MNVYLIRGEMRNRASQPAGFTLIEVLLVLVILVTLGAIAVPIFTGVGEDANKKAAKAQIQLFENAIEMFHFATKQYPASLDELVKPPSDATRAKRWTGPYLKENKGLIDPWDNEYKYDAKGKKNANGYDIWSLGPDGQNGTEDDIGNWESET
jgi:general secretion pathway protein G